MTAHVEHDIIVFDAHCVSCSRNAQFVITHDKARRFRLAAMQDESGRALFREAGIDPETPDSLVVKTRDKLLRDSDAVLYIYRHLGWPWRLAGLFSAIPRTVRDPFYRLIARNRYTLFGRRTECWVPRPDDRDRLL
jgi:predicted DCC family thiol-disulfide oxidoreductase YuxK